MAGALPVPHLGETGGVQRVRESAHAVRRRAGHPAQDEQGAEEPEAREEDGGGDRNEDEDEKRMAEFCRRSRSTERAATARLNQT